MHIIKNPQPVLYPIKYKYVTGKQQRSSKTVGTLNREGGITTSAEVISHYGCVSFDIQIFFQPEHHSEAGRYVDFDQEFSWWLGHRCEVFSNIIVDSAFHDKDDKEAGKYTFKNRNWIHLRYMATGVWCCNEIRNLAEAKAAWAYTDGIIRDKINELVEKHGLHLCVPKQKKPSKIAKPIKQYDMDGNLVRSWSGGPEIEKALGYKSALIRMCARGERESVYGYVWRY